jgi:hypothetical protein
MEVAQPTSKLQGQQLSEDLSRTAPTTIILKMHSRSTGKEMRMDIWHTPLSANKPQEKGPVVIRGSDVVGQRWSGHLSKKDLSLPVFFTIQSTWASGM